MPDPANRNTQLTLKNKQGLHARAAATLVRALTGMNAQILVSWDGRTVNGRSLLELMTLGAPRGSVLRVEISGADAEAALAVVTQVVENRFYEE